MPSVRTGSSCPRTPADREVSVPSPCYSCVLADLSSRLLLTSLQQSRPSPDPADEQPCFTPNRLLCSFLKPGVDPESHPSEAALALPQLARMPWPQAGSHSRWEKSRSSIPSTGVQILLRVRGTASQGHRYPMARHLELCGAAPRQHPQRGAKSGRGHEGTRARGEGAGSRCASLSPEG